MKRIAWCLILAVLVLDCYYTWSRRDTAKEWEVNPVASVVLGTMGVLGAIVYRIGWCAFAAVLAMTRTRLSWLITPVWFTGHCYLAWVLYLAMRII